MVPTFPRLPIIPPTPNLTIPSNATKPPCIIAFPNEGVRPFIHSSVAYPRAPAAKDTAVLIAKAPPTVKPPAVAVPAITGPKYPTPIARENPSAPPTIALLTALPQSTSLKSQPLLINCLPASKPNPTAAPKRVPIKTIAKIAL